MITDKNVNSVVPFVEDILVGSFSKILYANIITGEYITFKKGDMLDEEGFDDLPSIFDYVRKLVEDGLIYPEYAAACLRYANPDYVRKRVFSGERRIIQSYKRHVGDSYRWITFAMVAPAGCSPENPWVLFTWRDSDTDTTSMVDTLSTLSNLYYKILKINVTKDTFEPIKVEDREQEELVLKVESISEWWKIYVNSDRVHPEDKEVYRLFTDIAQIREQFREDSSQRLSCQYRRLGPDGEYRWVQMDLVPSIEYTDSNQVLIFFVKDVHEEHMKQMNDRQELLEYYNRDALTLLYNRHKFNDDLKMLSGLEITRFTCLYVDVNGLHEINNHLGHQAGDDMLCAVSDTLRKYFPEETLYRIGGDEFVVISLHLSKRSVERIVAEIKSDLLQDNYEIAAGVDSASDDPEALSVYKVVGAAELAMRTDKEEYYKSHAHDRRRRGLNEELEKVLTEKKYEEYFLKIIASHFAGVYFVDMQLDSVRHIYIPDFFAELLQKCDYCYSAAIKLYADIFVKPQYNRAFYRLLDYKYLSESLKQYGVVRLAYEKVDGAEMELQILSIDSDSEKNECVWIFSDISQQNNWLATEEKPD